MKVEPLNAHHDRTAFSCGVESLDHYLQTQASQDVRRMANGVFVLAALNSPATILGYYTLCATSLAQGDVSVAARKHIPRYPLVSATLIGRLAVAHSHHGEGLGALLLATPCAAPTPVPPWSARLWWWSTQSANRSPLSTKRTASCVCRSRFGSFFPWPPSRSCSANPYR